MRVCAKMHLACCKMRIWVQKSASMQKRTSPLKFGDLAEKSGLNSVSNLSTKVPPSGERAPLHSQLRYQPRKAKLKDPIPNLTPIFQPDHQTLGLVLFCIEADFCTQLRIF